MRKLRATLKSPLTSAKHQRDVSSGSMSSDAPLGLLAHHLLDLWRSAGDDGLIFICEDERRAEQVGAIVHAFEPGSGVMVLPSLSAAAINDVEPSPEIAGRRSSVLRRLAEQERVLLIASVAALGRRVPPCHDMRKSPLRLSSGGQFAEEDVRGFLVSGGYLVDERVEAPGMAIFLGQTLEIFPAGALGPVRIGYDAGRITEIHVYDLTDQRNLDTLGEVVIDVVGETDPTGTESSERTQPRRATAAVFDYCPSARLLIDHGVEAQARRRFSPTDATASAGLTQNEWDRHLARGGAAFLPATLPWPGAPTFFKDASPTSSFRRYLSEQRDCGRRVIFAAASKRDLRAMDRRAGAVSTLCADWKQAVAQARLDRPAAILVDLDCGFAPAEDILVVTAADLLGSRAEHQDIMAVGLRKDIRGRTLSPGDVVIHMERGMAILRDLASVSAAGVPDAEMIRLQFADDDQVLLRLSELRAIWRYSSESEGVSLDKADGSSWLERRAHAEDDIAATAAHIAERIAERNRRRVAPIVPPIADYETFAARFDYSPTADQANTISDVLADLASDRPMDRLVCGDVGYGKTEVALRAAAATVFAGRQVAVAVPTTVLARQHLETFRRRFSPFGVQVRLLSRFTPAADARAIKKELAGGTVSIVIGTHTLAGKGVKFKDLALLVVDEEQHFGKAHKTSLAALADGLNLLTMTATPIPRTLNEARAGLRSLSIIGTPPVRRMPVKTIVEPFHEATVAAALRREHRRRGQSFLVCARIEDIAPMAQRIRELVPELKTITLHGRMPAADIDGAMMTFAAGHADILLATNIIESGLDLPRANTIIVWRPDKFGLAQLHQLRGRVGRRSTISFALFLTDPGSAVSGAATKRLETLRKLDSHGAGFLISAGDMDLRGGGDLLSEKQSGHIQLLGADLSRHLLDQALGHANLAPFIDKRPDVRLDIPTLLPPSYVKDVGIRLELYARIFRCGSDSQLEELEDEIEERFGELPAEARDLIGLARFELACARTGILSVEVGPKSLAATFDSRRMRELPKRFRDDDQLEWNEGRLIYRRAAASMERLAVLEAFATTIGDFISSGVDQKARLSPKQARETTP
jgi:transcription-repair coupling factor (superfamily II helicase)